MRTSISMIALAALAASYDYCQSLGHDISIAGWIFLAVAWVISFFLSVVRDFQGINKIDAQEN